MSDTLSTFEVFQKFPNEETARQVFEDRRGVRGQIGKTAVVGIRDEDHQVRAMPVSNTAASTLMPFIQSNVRRAAPSSRI